MTLYNWPASLKRRSELWKLDAMSRSGGVSLSGLEQIVATPAGRWRAQLTVPIRRPEQIRDARWLVTALDGRANAVQIGPCDIRQLPWPVDAAGNRIDPARVVPDSRFTADQFGAGLGNMIAAQIVGAPVAGATSIRIRRFDIFDDRGVRFRMPFPLAGHYLGIFGRLYMVIGGAALDDDEAIYQIRPRLRISLPVDRAVVTAAARVPMRLADDSSGDLSLDLARFGTLTLDLVEALD